MKSQARQNFETEVEWFDATINRHAPRDFAAFPSCNSMSSPRVRSKAILWQCFPMHAGSTTSMMQTLAREMNLSETTFVLPRDPAIERERGVRVRIFTVQEELPFAGHPTLGTAFALRGSAGAGEVALELNVGRVPVRFEEKSGQPVFGEMTQVEPKFGLIHDRETVVRATSLRDGDIDPSLPIQTVSTGLPFTVVPLRGLDVMRRLQVNLASSSEYLKQSGGGNCLLFRDPRDGRSCCPPACPHAVLRRRRSSYRLSCGLRYRLDGGAWSGSARRARSHRAGCRDASAEPDSCAGFAPWITKWLTCAWEEMLWKSCAEKFLSEPTALIAAKKYEVHNREIFFNGAN